MMIAKLTRRNAILGGAFALASPAVLRAQGAMPKVRFCAGWSFAGNQSYMLRAQHSGFFKQEGVDVTVSRGFGSSRLPVDIAGGIFDIGAGEMSATLKFLAENPDADVMVVAILEDTNQMSMTVLADGPVKTPKDIEGKSLAAPEADVGRQLFPAYAKFAGIDPKKVTWVSVAPELREPMLVQKRVAGITGNTSSTALNLKRLGVDLPKQKIFYYREAGFDLYSNCYVASRKFAEKNPEALKATLRGLFRAYLEYYRDPTEAIKVLATVEPLTDVKVETERVAFLKSILPLGKAMKEQGISTVDPARLEMCIRTVEEAYGLPPKLTKERVYNGAFLPPSNLRMV